MRSIQRTALTAALFLSIGVLASCKGGGTTSIKTLLDDPSRYDKQTVRIAGTVESSIGAFGLGGYKIDDGTGSLRVVTKEGGVPREGAKVGVEGEFRSAYTIGTHSGAVLIEKRRMDAP